MVDAGCFNGMVNVIKNYSPIYAWQLALLDVLARDPITLDQLAGFIVATSFAHFRRNGLLPFGVSLFCVAKFLTQEAYMVVDLDDAAFSGEILHHLVGHVAGGVTECSARGMRSN